MNQAPKHVFFFSSTYDKFFDLIDDNHGTDHTEIDSCEINTTDKSISFVAESTCPDDDRGQNSGSITIYNINHAQKKKIKNKLLELYSDVRDLDYSSE